ncbi:hypothetical protein K8B83_16385 [Shewanella inventionis]|uniref:Uncharacterized protein n=2 Tax=Shewanella inventionis TaxID=1738770 RepID=A0ABQ1J232_9GAMM|nr:hypothetical protein [Shewanella inventionis]MCL1157350.1 hypothetical protein [Shewanella inventionis]UAL42418.1 hypothetical protein K8B83_16385 [Shewanella inventionis]GGB58201.1 hypothetical protein GCM10011607_18480 [Shewanella inventionis]
MRLTTLFFAFVNYAFNDKGRRAGKATLFHSLRLTEEMALKQKYLTKSQKLMRSKNEIEIEWDSSLSHTNLIDTPDGIVPLDNFSQEQREQMMFEILQPETMKSADARKLGQDKARSKNKLKEWIKAGHFCKKGIELVDEIFSSDSLINVHHAAYRLNLLDMKRKAQRVEQLVNYIKAHNTLLDKPNSLNSVNFEELLFKIPINNQIGTDIVSNEEMMHAMKSFLQRYYPDYPIKLMVLHHDERLPGEVTGGHVHAFISGKNALTHQYDLRIAQIKKVNEFLFKRDGMSATLFSEIGRLNYEQAGDVAKHMQEMFYEFVNEHLFHPKNINAAFHPESVRKSEKRKQMRREAKLAKRDRAFNYHARLLENVNSLEIQLKSFDDKISERKQVLDDVESKIINVSESYDALTIKHDALEQQCIQQEERLSDIEIVVQQKQRRLSKKMLLEQEVDERLNVKVEKEKKLDASIWLKQQKHTELDNAIAEKQSILDRLSVMTTQALLPVHKMLEHMNNRLILKGRSGAAEFMQYVIKAFSADLPAELRKILIKIANNTGDTELENALTRKDSQINDSLDM